MLITGGVNSKRRSIKTPGVYSDTPDYAPFARAEAFRVATYNIENYLDATSPRGCVKSAEAKAKVRESIRAINPDVLALQEVGSEDTLLELRDSLKAEGLDFPHWEHVTGSDVDLHVAILSRFPFAARRPHTDDSFELNGQQFRVRRGFAEVDVQVNPGYQFTLFAAHLKSRNAVPDGDAAGLRLGEAKLLRAKIDARLAKGAEAKIIVLGDFNDTEDSAVVQTIRGAGGGELFDTRPAERDNGAIAIPEPGVATEDGNNKDAQARSLAIPGPGVSAQGPAWTTFYDGRMPQPFEAFCAPEPQGKGGPLTPTLSPSEGERGNRRQLSSEPRFMGRYERIDFLLISQALVGDWVVAESRVLAIPCWRTASDHRPVVAAFRAGTG
jgi:endonuclease/exonuclease/phosphatase family metal-dependent hydrolase